MTLSITHELLAILSGLWGGARYGFKIRMPHALVMTVLFRRDLSSREKLRQVLKLALEHASNLASFVTLYKSILMALKWASRRIHQFAPGVGESEGMWRYFGRMLITMIIDGPYVGQRLELRPPGYPERSHHALLAGAVGGYFVWGRYSSVNYQIVLYLASRVLVAGVKRLHHHAELPEKVSNHSYPLFAATVWGLVMMLFESSPEVLHPSLKKSMDEIYRFQLSSHRLDSSNSDDFSNMGGSSAVGKSLPTETSLTS